MLLSVTSPASCGDIFERRRCRVTLSCKCCDSWKYSRNRLQTARIGCRGAADEAASGIADGAAIERLRVERNKRRVAEVSQMVKRAQTSASLAGRTALP